MLEFIHRVKDPQSYSSILSCIEDQEIFQKLENSNECRTTADDEEPVKREDDQADEKQRVAENRERFLAM